jgi:competence protein ComEC
VLKVAHHGSGDPELPALLDQVRPRVAVIPVGPNTYGHPHRQTVGALRAGVPMVRRTDRDGTVRIVPGEGGAMTVGSAR